jgi:hypothetical protein
MLRLYSGSGSREIQLIRQAPLAEWAIFKRNVCRFLEDSGNRDAADVLRSNPFELWSGTNGFGDDFQVLYLRADTKAYLVFEKQVDENYGLHVYEGIARGFEGLNCPIRFVAVDVEINDAEEVDAVSPPNLRITSAVVERALTDAELLIKSGGAISGLDRVHTAFHGYLKLACESAGLAFSADPNITELFKTLRRNHPALRGPFPGAADVGRILGAMATIADALNPLRNRGSVAHPNEHLLEEPEAMLAVNSVRTLLHYLNARIRP